jgi:hypothetical protein
MSECPYCGIPTSLHIVGKCREHEQADNAKAMEEFRAKLDQAEADRQLGAWLRWVLAVERLSVHQLDSGDYAMVSRNGETLYQAPNLDGLRAAMEGGEG